MKALWLNYRKLWKSHEFLHQTGEETAGVSSDRQVDQHHQTKPTQKHRLITSLFIHHFLLPPHCQSVWRRSVTWRRQQIASLRWWRWLPSTSRPGSPCPPCSSSWAGRSAPSRPWSPCTTPTQWHRTRQLHKRQGTLSVFVLVCVCVCLWVSRVSPGPKSLKILYGTPK